MLVDCSWFSMRIGAKQCLILEGEKFQKTPSFFKEQVYHYFSGGVGVDILF
jgi:hypothetical protein